ncbi:MAG: hypothetical protein RLZZ215_2016 [Pseudomonadota bacterium]|jgi:predicted ATP-binding protein involved in virulence
MHVEKINIDKFRVLEAIEIKFQPPNSKTAHLETGNVVNVIAGVNGCGKTSLLEALFIAVSNPVEFCYDKKYGKIVFSDFGEINTTNWNLPQHKIEQLNKKNSGVMNFYDDPRVLFLPSQQIFQYSSVAQLTNSYSFGQRIDINSILGRAEFYIKEYVLNSVLESNLADPKERMSFAVNTFNKFFLDAKLLTKLVGLSKELFNKPIFQNASGHQVTIEQLSDGEKQLYGRVISLMILQPNNSIILIDEPEIALHPAWQQKIMQIYSRIGKNNQFIVATHSPQIIASVPYQNRILLRKENNKIVPIHCSQPPSGLDVNSILSEIMGAEPRPPEVLELYRQYRQFVEERKENTPEALAVKAKLSEESDHSQFMQEMNFLIDLRDL